MEQEKIITKGVRENNLKNINLEIPKKKLVTITGISGSGKSSFAFDTLYLEGYRRYMENLSGHAHFFLHSVRKPKFKKIENLCPTISISQKNGSQNPRSTVGTLTGIYGFLRIVYAQYGKPHCPYCNKELKRKNLGSLLKDIKKMEDDTEILITFSMPVKNADKQEAIKKIENLGYSKVVIEVKEDNKNDGEEYCKVLRLSEMEEMEDYKSDSYQILVDKFILDKSRIDKERIIDSLQTATKLSEGGAQLITDSGSKLVFSRSFFCPDCGYMQDKLSSKNFSFNSPDGPWGECKGMGEIAQVDSSKIIPNKNLSLEEGAIEPWVRMGGRSGGFNLHKDTLGALAKKMGFSLRDPVKNLTKKQLDSVIWGLEEKLEFKNNFQKKKVLFQGVAGDLKERYEKAESSPGQGGALHRRISSNSVKKDLEKYFSFKTCPSCQGKRLKPEFLAVKAFGKSLGELIVMEIEDLVNYLENYSKGDKKNKKQQGQNELIKEIIRCLKPLRDSGVGYLSLNRGCRSLSGGELQRVRIATQLYSGLSGVLYILDEPTIGLHSKDTKKLIKIFKKLKEKGNSVVIVEHDKEIIEASDQVIDFGPGAGEEGGEVIFQGNFDELRRSKSKTADFFNGKIRFESNKRKIENNLQLRGANHNNLKNIDLDIPLNALVSFAGVSGSGKSSLVVDVLARALNKEVNKNVEANEVNYKEIKGLEKVKKVVTVDQSSIGRSPRSNPATYSGIFSYIRDLFAETESASKLGLKSSHFSFNMRGGRCEYCQGNGVVKMDMPLLDDVYSTCPRCQGTRYNKKVLSVEYHGANIAQVLDMSIKYAYYFFNSCKPVRERLKLLCDVGLGYLKLGQSATKLSGGEAQRIKLAAELVRKSGGNCVYILDEPTVGLHFSDIEKLLKVLNGLVDQGNSVFVIEHNADLLRASDWVIELGPDGGKKGGEVVFQGTPQDLTKVNTETGKILRENNF
ncbi:MAG: excinuclease ABC subunit UvrA [Candidatus Moraniibacteriota bacterium]